MYRNSLLPCVLTAALLAPSAHAVEDETTLGFVFTYLWYDLYQGDDACKEPAIGTAEYARPKLPKSERSGPMAGDLLQKLRNYSIKGHTGSDTNTQGILPATEARKNVVHIPGNIDMCYRPADYDDPPHRVVTGPTALGMDLDRSDSAKASAAPKQCARQPFKSPAGDEGIDNQFYRVIGCISSYRHDGAYRALYSDEIQDRDRKEGRNTTLLEITGVDDPRNDDDVQVGIFSSLNPTQYDSAAKGLSWVSYTAGKEARWNNVLKGRIKDGILTTTPADVRIHKVHNHSKGEPAEWYIRDARLRLELRPDGSAAGELAGYFDLESLYDVEFKGYHGAVMQSYYGYSCPAVYASMKQLADGYPDPATGQCTAISSALKVEAVRAFVFRSDTKGPQQSARR